MFVGLNSMLDPSLPVLVVSEDIVGAIDSDPSAASELRGAREIIEKRAPKRFITASLGNPLGPLVQN